MAIPPESVQNFPIKTILEHHVYKIILYDFAHQEQEIFLITKTLHKYPHL